MVTWNVHPQQSSPSTYITVMSDALPKGEVQVPSNSTTNFRLVNGDHTIVFDGAFTLGALDILTGGTITGFHVYYGAVELLDASGYAIDLDDFLSRSAATQAGISLLFEVPRTINGSPEGELITGRSESDAIFGNGGTDTIYGDFGDDFISGGAGADTLVGDAGDFLGTGVDTVDYSEKTGALSITLSATSQTTVKVDGVAEDIISEFENANGGSGNDYIAGSAVANRLVGNAGNDILVGLEGGDTLLGGLGDDVYLARLTDAVIEAAGEGIDTVGTDMSYTLGANVENLRLIGDGALTGTGNDLANMIFGSDGNNLLDGGLGADTMVGGRSDDTYVVDNVGDVVTDAYVVDNVTEIVGEGVDTVNASVSFALGADLENLVLTGAAAIDGTGNEFANAITGNAGANLLAGGLGLDVLTGGEGSDTFIFDTKLAAANVDHVSDFVAGLDHIGLDADIFRKVNDSGKLKAKFFADGKADDGNDFIVYKEKSGKLFYDKDGDGDAKGKLVAVFDGAPHDVSAGDFLIL